MEYSNDEILKELRRELKMRRACFPKWVDYGRITQTSADHRIGALAAAIALIETLPKPVDQKELF